MSGEGEPDTFSAETPKQAFAAIVEGRKMPGYEPAHDWGLANPGGGVETARGIAWETAPHSSHIHSYRWLDARKRTRMADLPSKLGQGRSELHVRFKRPNGGPTEVYVYFFVDHSQGEAIYQRLKSSPHPFGQVLHPEVIKEQVPYTSVA